MEILFNMAHFQYYPRQCHAKAILQIWRINLKSLLSCHVNESSSGINYVLNEHEDVDQYGPYAIPSEMMPCYSSPASLMNQSQIPIHLSY